MPPHQERHVASPGIPAEQRKVIAARTSARHWLHPGDQGLMPLAELIRQTAGARPISSVDDLRCDAFETGQELDEFLAFVADSRQSNFA
jgi:hypothetical protein